MLGKIKIYKCFSTPLKEFLMANGEEYICVAIDPKQQKTFWMFVKSEHLNELLKQWTNNKK